MASLMILFLSLGCLTMPAISMNECLIGESFWCSTFENAVSCSAVEFCSSVWKNNNLEKELSTGNECQQCRNVLTNMKVVVQDQDSKELIKFQATESICNAMETDKKMCRAIINQPIEDVFKSLLSDNDAITRCQVLDYCRPEVPLPQVSNSYHPVNSFWCKFCIKAFDEVKKAIGSNPSREKVEEELAKTCNHVPKIIRKECEKVIKKFADKLIDLLLQKVSSENICKAIHACSTQLCANGEIQEVSNQCETCEVVVRLLEGLSEGNSSALRSVLLQSCPKLPCKYQVSCLTFEENHGESLLQLLKSLAPTEKICKMLNVCTDAEQRTSSFKCIAGPTFWCSSPVNAKFCEAEEHCKKYMWV